MAFVALAVQLNYELTRESRVIHGLNEITDGSTRQDAKSRAHVDLLIRRIILQHAHPERGRHARVGQNLAARVAGCAFELAGDLI